MKYTTFSIFFCFELHQGGCVFASVYLSVCVCLTPRKVIQKVINRL